MKLLTLALASTAVLFMAPAVQAAVVIDSTSLEKTTGPTQDGDTVTLGFSDSKITSPTFSEFLTFTNDFAGIYDLEVSTSNRNVDFTRAYLVGPGAMEFELTRFLNQGALELWGATGVNGGAGQYTLNIFGNNRNPGTLNGSITVLNQIPAVPEPATWMFMLLGMGGIGYSMRRKNKQTVRVQYA